MKSYFDVIILGQGLAGTALAWSLRWLGARVLVVDREAKVTSSKVAAGLITPVTGQKLVKTWRHSELWPVALSYYDRVQRETGSEFFRRIPMVRLFTTDTEVSLFNRRMAAGEFGGSVRQSDPYVNETWFTAGKSGFEMSDGGQLDVLQYLAASQRNFECDGGYVGSAINLPDDIEIAADRVSLPQLDVSAKTIVFCQGVDAIPNPWFRDVQFKPAKGEILTLRIPGLTEGRVIHQGVWLAPLGNDLFKSGATYDWKNLDSQSTLAGRDEIIGKLTEFLRLPFDVVSHEAAVRPIHRNQYPVLGLHPEIPRLCYFNGLGSKGSLQAPFFAQQLANVLMKGGSIDSNVDLNRKTKWTGRAISQRVGSKAFHVKRGQPPMTQQAQDVIREVVMTGETVVDATTGNGYDTQFLAELVGPHGTVFAFDVQQAALDSTAKRLKEANLQNVVLINQDHARLTETIPEHQRGQVGAVMFNLGYLPGGDKRVMTNADSTRRAITHAVQLLRPEGILTILAYTGHDGGAAEALAVAAALEKLSQAEFDFDTFESQPGRTSGPRMFVVRRLSTRE